MSDANLKNEVTIKGSNDTEYTLRPTFMCLMEIERKSGKSILKMIDEFTTGQGSLKDMTVILKEGTRAAGKPIREAEIEALIEDIGLMTVSTQLIGFFVKSLYGGKAIEALEKKSQDQPIVLNS